MAPAQGWHANSWSVPIFLPCRLRAVSPSICQCSIVLPVTRMREPKYTTRQNWGLSIASWPFGYDQSVVSVLISLISGTVPIWCFRDYLIFEGWWLQWVYSLTIMGWPGIALPPGLAHSPQGENIQSIQKMTKWYCNGSILPFIQNFTIFFESQRTSAFFVIRHWLVGAEIHVGAKRGSRYSGSSAWNEKIFRLLLKISVHWSSLWEISLFLWTHTCVGW